MIDTILLHLPLVATMLFGTSIHVAKKAAKARLTDKTFSLKDYLLGHPYQSYAALGMTVGAYFELVSDPENMPALLAVFLAGVASNSLADLMPGER